MGVAEELEKLAELHRSGALNEREYEEAKQAVLMAASTTTSAEGEAGIVDGLFGPRQGTIGEAANRYVSFQIVMSAVTAVIFLLVFVFVFLPRFF